DQRVNLDGFAFHQHRLKRLNAQAVQSWSAVQQNRVVLNHLFEDVPNDGFLLLHHFLGLLDCGAVAGLLEPVVNERLEQLQGHLLGQTALVQLEFRSDHDDRTARVIHALAEQVLTEAALLALQSVGQRLQRAIVGATQHASTTPVIEQGIHSFLQHALFVAHDYFRGVQVHQFLQAVVAVDHAPIQVVQIGGCKAATIERNERTQLRRNDRNYIQNHPVWLITALAESLDHFQALGVLQALLHRALVLHFFAKLDREALNFHALEQFLNGFRAHHGFKTSGAILLVKLAELRFILDYFAFFDRSVARFDHDVGFEVQNRLKIAQRDIEQVTDTAGQAFEEPHV